MSASWLLGKQEKDWGFLWRSWAPASSELSHHRDLALAILRILVLLGNRGSPHWSSFCSWRAAPAGPRDWGSILAKSHLQAERRIQAQSEEQLPAAFKKRKFRSKLKSHSFNEFSITKSLSNSSACSLWNKKLRLVLNLLCRQGWLWTSPFPH